MISKMPKIATLRRHFPDCTLSDARMMEIAGWLKDHLKQEHITPTNKQFKILIAWEDK